MADADEQWVKEQEKLMSVGQEIVKHASDEALDYVQDAVEHINDRAWRKMSMSTQSIEIGIGVGIAEQLIPNVYDDMTKSMHKKLKIKKQTAEALRYIYIGRVIKNIRKALDERNQ